MSDTLVPRRGADAGREWLSGVDRPSRTLRLDGLPAGDQAHTLVVANPSDLEAVVEVEVSGSSGRFVPTGLDPVSVAPGVVDAVDLSDVVPQGEPVAVRLTSRVPVVASVRSRTRTDHQYAAPTLSLVGPAVAPLDRDTTASVQLTAGDVDAQAELTAYDARGERLAGTTLDVPATATAAWAPSGRAAAYVVVRPVTGRVHGAVVYAAGRDGTAVATVPLVALPFRVEQATVVPYSGSTS